MTGFEIVGGSDGLAGGGGGGGGGAAGGGGAGDTGVYQGASAGESSDFQVTWTAATQLTLSELPFPPAFENFVAIYEYDGDNLVKAYSIDDANYDWTWAPGLDASTGILTVAPAVFGAASTFVVVLRGPKRDIMEILDDFSGLTVHQSQRDFDAVWGSATTIAITNMVMDPGADDIRAVVEITTTGRVRMAYSRKEWAFTWVAGAAGAGVLTIAAATLQATSSFIVFIEGPEHNTKLLSDAGDATRDGKITQHQDQAGKIQPAGADATSAITMMQLGALIGLNGDGIYKSDIHFTAVQFSVTQIDITGGFPTISSIGQFLGVAQISNTGVVTIFYPHQNVFAWDAVNDRLTITGASLDATDVFVMVIAGVDRHANDPGNYKMVGEVSPYPLRSDDTGIELITAAQTLTIVMADVGPEISTFGYNVLKLFLTIDINGSNDLQVRVLDKHTSAGVEEYSPVIETVGATDIGIEPAYWEATTDTDQLLSVVYQLDGVTPFVQVQARVAVLGAPAADLDAAYYVRGWR